MMSRPIHLRVSAPSEVKGFAGWSIILPPLSDCYTLTPCAKGAVRDWRRSRRKESSSKESGENEASPAIRRVQRNLQEVVLPVTATKSVLSLLGGKIDRERPGLIIGCGLRLHPHFYLVLPRF